MPVGFRVSSEMWGQLLGDLVGEPQPITYLARPGYGGMEVWLPFRGYGGKVLWDNMFYSFLLD